MLDLLTYLAREGSYCQGGFLGVKITLSYPDLVLGGFKLRVTFVSGVLVESEFNGIIVTAYVIYGFSSISIM
jgi:hypothetical protein